MEDMKKHIIAMIKRINNPHLVEYIQAIMEKLIFCKDMELSDLILTLLSKSI